MIVTGSVPVRREHRDRDQHHADHEMERRDDQHRPRQQLQRKHDLLHQVAVVDDERRRARHAFGEEAVHDHPGVDDERESAAIGHRTIPAHPEHDAEDERVDREQQQRIEDRPAEADQRTAIAARRSRAARIARAGSRIRARCRTGRSRLDRIAQGRVEVLRAARSGNRPWGCPAGSSGPAARRPREPVGIAGQRQVRVVQRIVVESRAPTARRSALPRRGINCAFAGSSA